MTNAQFRMIKLPEMNRRFLKTSLAWIVHRLVRRFFTRAQQSSVRSGMFIEPVIEKAPSSVGAARRSVSISVSLMPLLRSLGFPGARYLYKHAAPDGAVSSVPHGETCGR